MSEPGRGRGEAEAETRYPRPRPSGPRPQVPYSVDRELIVADTPRLTSSHGFGPMGQNRGLPLVGCLDVSDEQSETSRSVPYIYYVYIRPEAVTGRQLEALPGGRASFPLPAPDV